MNSSIVHRTGPFPVAADYSKPLLQALVAEDETTGAPAMQMGNLSRLQLLLTTLVERVHDAIYVLPRHARDTALGMSSDTPSGGGAPPDPDEYARDVVMAIEGMKKFAKLLPDDSMTDSEFEERFTALSNELQSMRESNVTALEKGRKVEAQLREQLDSSMH